MKKVILISTVLILFGFLNLNAQEKQAVKKASASKDTEVTLSVKMHCQDCAEKVKKQLSFTKGVKDVSYDLEKQTVNVKFRDDKTDANKLIASLSEIGYPAKVATKSCCSNNAVKKSSSCSEKVHDHSNCSKKEAKKEVN